MYTDENGAVNSGVFNFGPRPPSDHSPSSIRENFSRILQLGGGSHGDQCGSVAGSVSSLVLPRPGATVFHPSPNLHSPLTMNVSLAGPPSQSSLGPSSPARALLESQSQVRAALVSSPSIGMAAVASSSTPFRVAPTGKSMPHQGISENSSSASEPSSQFDQFNDTTQKDSFLWRGEKQVKSNFTTFFCLTWCLMFMVPTWTAVHLSYDATVIYWCGSWCRLAIFLPAFVIYGYVAHALNGGLPHKTAVWICIFVPSIFIFQLNASVMKQSVDQANVLSSEDCDTSHQKRELQRSWEKARDLYDKCLTETVSDYSSQNMTLDVAQQLYRIHDCDEYPPAFLENQRDWDYLRQLEEEHACGGWCTFDIPLWTFKDAKDSCTFATGQVFKGKVSRLTSQNFVYLVTLIFIVAMVMVLSGPMMRSCGHAW
eukprot:TRINITY_DN76205_c0_g1_i1.p1 TRINITY_DN76205_c0_g1~~TRINITY_DN76205_c0_g1_i1.p1  ORF type:complete len:427 (-),score=58.69 TRINITY_DN76205_c0_g1_i1:53-1333(-)